MNKYCPNKNLPEWKELVQVVGENKAYYLWDQNKGNGLDKAPNGNDSKLFIELLNYYEGDRRQAVEAKAKIYSHAFKTWFGDWLNDPKNSSKVIDENGEPLVVYHGGAKSIQVFKNSSETGSNTGSGYYTDPNTNERIPVDSNRTIFFSSNKYVGESYGVLRAINQMFDLKSKVKSLLGTVYGDEASIDPGVFKDFDDFYNTLKELSNYNERFSKLEKYLKSIRQKGERLKPNEIEAFRQILKDVNEKLRQFDKWDLNLTEWSYVLNRSKEILHRYNSKEGIRKLLNGEIPQEMLYEYSLFKKIEEQREKQQLPKIANYEEVHVILSNASRHYFIYDGNKLKTWDPSYSDKNVTDMSEQELEWFLQHAITSNEYAIQINKEAIENKQFNDKYDLYPIFLNVRNPLIHDYEGTHQGQGYKQSKKHPFGYVAARQVNKAIKDGNDGVVYLNLYDPYLADNYGIFNPNQAKSINNIGTFSTIDNNIYHKYGSLGSNQGGSLLQQLGEFSDVIDVVNFLINHDEVEPATKNLLKKLNEINRPFIIYQGSKGNGVRANAGAALYLYSDVIKRSSVEETAQDVAHEMLHIYLRKEYDTNPEFRAKLDELQKKYRQKLGTEWYGLGTKDKSDEFLNEFLSNLAFREALKKTDKSLFQRIWEVITGIINALIGKESNRLPKDLQALQKYAINLLNGVNQGEISIYNIDQFRETYTGEGFNKLSSKQQNQIDKLYDKIQKGLKDRLNAIKHYTVKNPKVWNQLSTVISQLSRSETEQGILQFVQHVNDTIGDSIKFLSKPIEQINAKQIRQLSNDYLGFYKPLIDQIQYAVDTTDIFKELPDYATIKQNIADIVQQLTVINNRFTNILKEKGYQFLQEYLQSRAVPQDYIDKTIAWLDDPKHDTSVFMNWFGMATNSDNMVLQTIANMLQNTVNKTDRDTLEVGTELVKQLNAAKEKYGNDVQKLLYEKYDDGTYTGLRVSPINKGQFKRDQKEYLSNLANKLNIQKDEHDQYVMPDDEDTQRKWFEGVNKFYSEKANRKYKPEYYTTRNRMLSMKTRDAINEINNYINTIVDPITVDGVEYVNLLTESEYNALLSLRKQKQLLSNRYNLDGSIKTGDDLIIANELSAFNEVVKQHVKYKTDKESYNRDRAKIVAKYGEGSAQLALWESRNLRKQYNQQFYDDLDSLGKVEQTEEYKEAIKKRREFQQLFKDPRTGKIDSNLMSDSEKESLLKLDNDIARLYTWVETNMTDKKFSDIAEVVPTEQYYKDSENARQSGTEAYNDWFNKNHYEDGRGKMHPASYYTELKPKDELLEKYTEYVPMSKYSTLDQQSDWFNKDWDPAGPAIQPNKKYYNNSKAYKEVIDKPELKKLYDSLSDTMKKANEYISFLTFSDEDKMPQIPARFMQVLGRKDNVLNALKYVFDDIAVTRVDDTDYVEDFTTMPNGDPIKVIPTRFINMLDDTNEISTDAVASVIAYYNMATNYNNMVEQQDDVELLLNLLKNIQIRTKKELKTAGSANVYKQAQLLVDRIMYGRNKTPITINVLDKEINLGKTLDIIRGFVTKVNLSGNLWSIGTSFFTDATYTTLEAKMGRFFDTNDLKFASSEFARQLPDIMANIGNPIPKGKLAYLLQLNQVVKDNREIFDRLDQSQVLRAINQNFWFAGYNQSDYTVKSHTVISIYHSYRFVEGEGFMTKQQYINKYNSDSTKFEQLSTTLYDVFTEDKDGNIKVQNKYKQFVTDKLQNEVRNRINILTQRIDGTLREIDKAAVHANSIASYIVLHRNFMISALHDRFKRKQFNLDLGVEEEGYYRSTSKFLKNVIGQRHFAMAQLLADYNNLKDYEQYAVRRVLNELVLIAASTTVALAIATIVDGDDEYDIWLNQSITYLAMRSAFEFRTMYNPFEFISLIKSPTAAFNWFDNASSFINLINPASYVGDRTPFTIIDRGPYEGLPVILKNIIKVTPFKSIMEATDPKAKRNYLQNQLMNF